MARGKQHSLLFYVNTCSRREARENVSERVMIGFGFILIGWESCASSFKPIMQRSSSRQLHFVRLLRYWNITPQAWRGKKNKAGKLHKEYMSLLKACMSFFLECSFAEVVASKPCLGSGASITEEECKRRSDECCVLENNGDSKCLRTKKKQPSSGDYGEMHDGRFQWRRFTEDILDNWSLVESNARSHWLIYDLWH